MFASKLSNFESIDSSLAGIRVVGKGSWKNRLVGKF